MQTGSSVDSCYNAVDSERPHDSVWRLCHPEGIGGEEALGQEVEGAKKNLKSQLSNKCQHANVSSGYLS